MEAITIDENILDADDPAIYTNPIFEDLCSDHDVLHDVRILRT
jgi:hypothetical protein